MKVGIVIPLKSQAVSKDWKQTCENLFQTVRSIKNQTSDNYTAIVVGHEQPEFLTSDNTECDFLTFTDAPPPVKGEDERENQLRYEKDRCQKILKGMIHLNKIDPEISHWFALDADDILHRDFAKTLEKYGDYEAIILERGYFWFQNTGILNKEDSFSAYCGSSAILSKSLCSLPAKIDGENFREVPYGSISHVHMREKLTDQGVKLATPNERVILYSRDNGENISNAAYCSTWNKKVRKLIKSLIRMRFDKRKVLSDFSLQ